MHFTHFLVCSTTLNLPRWPYFEHQSNTPFGQVLDGSNTGRMIGHSGVAPPGGDVTGVGAAAIVRQRLPRVEESALGPDEAYPKGEVMGFPVRS